MASAGRELPTVRGLAYAYQYRTARGGRVPLTLRQQKQLLELYADHARPVREIAEIFGVSVGTVYRWLPHLGVRAQ